MRPRQQQTDEVGFVVRVVWMGALERIKKSETTATQATCESGEASPGIAPCWVRGIQEAVFHLRARLQTRWPRAEPVKQEHRHWFQTVACRFIYDTSAPRLTIEIDPERERVKY